MILRYIFHSGFLLETSQCILVFDYWMDPAGVMSVYMNTCKPVYVFSSHFHEDHFTKEIFKWKNRIPNVTYILSKDILKRRRAQKEDADVWMVKGTVWEDEYLKVTATGSNDSGVSWIVETEGKTIQLTPLSTTHLKERSSAKSSVNISILWRRKSDSLVNLKTFER